MSNCKMWNLKLIWAGGQHAVLSQSKYILIPHPEIILYPVHTALRPYEGNANLPDLNTLSSRGMIAVEIKQFGKLKTPPNLTAST